MKIDTSLKEELRANIDAAKKFAVIISFQDSGGVAVLRRLGIEPAAIYQNIAGAAAEITAAQIEALASAPEVTSIESDKPANVLNRP